MGSTERKTQLLLSTVSKFCEKHGLPDASKIMHFDDITADIFFNNPPKFKKKDDKHLFELCLKVLRSRDKLWQMHVGLMHGEENEAFHCVMNCLDNYARGLSEKNIIPMLHVL